MKMIHGMMEIQDFNHDKSGKPRRRQCKKKMDVSSGCIPVFTGCVTQCGLLIYCEKFGVLSGRMRFRIF